MQLKRKSPYSFKQPKTMQSAAFTKSKENLNLHDVLTLISGDGTISCRIGNRV